MRFIAAAIDRDVPDRGEQDFFRKIGAQSERDTTGKPLQGMYVATPDGKPLAARKEPDDFVSTSQLSDLLGSGVADRMARFADLVGLDGEPCWAAADLADALALLPEGADQ